MVISTVNSILSTLTLITGLVVSFFLIFVLIMKIRGNKKEFENIKYFFYKHGAWMIFTISFVAMLGSLFFSEYARYSVCVLCWYQRILMYPLVIISGVMMLRKSKELLFVIIPMSIIGIVIAAYHYYIQVFQTSVICVDGIDCAARPFLSYGYISIPMMALTAFSAILIISLLSYYSKDKRKIN